jgi:predicted ATPase/DNA-binding CsgD family transcriptional regulator
VVSGSVSPRERAVLELLGEHLTHAEIGQRLFISVRTVESHVASLRRKLELPDHRALVRLAVEQRSSVAAPSLIAPLTSFVGRETELAELAAALESSRLVSAVGPGGAGKTRLAIAAAQACISRFAQGVRMVDLVPVADTAALEETVAQACAAAPSSQRGPVEALISTLRRQQILLVLDNCEYHVDAVAVLVERLVTACSELTVLVTSRIRLSLAFERVYRVEGLSEGPDGDAVALFVDRAVAAGSPVPSLAERERISAVCRALDGLALAVELAAVRLPSLGLDGVESGLLDQAVLLTGGTRLNVRQRSMHETLEWSTALLDPDANAVLRRLAVLAAPFHEDTAAAVAAFGLVSTEDVSAALTKLTDHSLLTTSTTVEGRRVIRLLEPVRQYGLAQMTRADMPAFAQHLLWCLRMVRALVAGTLVDAVPAVADDIRAALGWALGQDRPPSGAHELARSYGLLLFRAGSLREAQLRMEQAAELAPDGFDATADLGRAAAVAKCRVLGEEALRLELAAADAAQAAGADTAAGMALARAAELLTRFPGMFTDPDVSAAQDMVQRAHALAPDDPHVGAGVAVALAGYSHRPDGQTQTGAHLALERARAVQDVLLESAAIDAVTGELVLGGDIIGAHRLAVERVARLMADYDDPAAGLELKDALHSAVFCALGAGDIDTARTMAQRQHALPFLREQRDLASEELLAPAALAGDWATVLHLGAQFLEDWTAAGRPRAAGRGLAPAAVALAHGLRGDRVARAQWLAVLAEIRDLPVSVASRGSGYGEIFDALVLLHEEQPWVARELLESMDTTGFHTLVFRQWSSALAAECAVLMGADDADRLLDQASQVSTGNPIATAITRRAAALLATDRDALAAVAADFEQAGSDYQRARTLTLSSMLTAQE